MARISEQRTALCFGGPNAGRRIRRQLTDDGTPQHRVGYFLEQIYFLAPILRRPKALAFEDQDDHGDVTTPECGEDCIGWYQLDQLHDFRFYRWVDAPGWRDGKQTR